MPRSWGCYLQYGPCFSPRSAVAARAHRGLARRSHRQCLHRSSKSGITRSDFAGPTDSDRMQLAATGVQTVRARPVMGTFDGEARYVPWRRNAVVGRTGGDRHDPERRPAALTRTGLLFATAAARLDRSGSRGATFVRANWRISIATCADAVGNTPDHRWSDERDELGTGLGRPRDIVGKLCQAVW